MFFFASNLKEEQSRINWRICTNCISDVHLATRTSHGVMGPHVICTSCSSGLRDWLNKRNFQCHLQYPWSGRNIKITILLLLYYRHYRFLSKNKHTIVYSYLESACRPIPHDISLPIPIPMPQRINFVSEMVEDLQFVRKSSYILYRP